MTVPEFAGVVCNDLPEGWQLLLCMERHSGGFELLDFEGYRIAPEDYTSVDKTLIEQGLDAVAYAVQVTASVQKIDANNC